MSIKSSNKFFSPGDYNILSLEGYNRAGAADLFLHLTGHLGNLKWWRGPECDHLWRFYHDAEPGSSIVVDGRRFQLRPNRAIVIPKGVEFYRYGKNATQQHLWIHFSPPPGFFLDASQYSQPIHPALLATLTDLRHRMIHREVDNEADSRAIYHSTLAVIHLWMAGIPLKVSAQSSPAVAGVLQKIGLDPGRPTSNRELAQAAGMSVENFIRRFKNHVGDTPARYLVRQRIQEAGRLLVFTDRSIEEIAEEVGFTNRHHFSRLFSRETGKGPAAFRKQNGNKTQP